MSEKIKLANTDELSSGEGKQVELESQGLSLALFNIEGSFYCIDGICPHAGAPLGEGEVDGNAVICPWHAWGFDVMTGSCSVQPGMKQRNYPVLIEDNQVFIQV